MPLHYDDICRVTSSVTSRATFSISCASREAQGETAVWP